MYSRLQEVRIQRKLGFDIRIRDVRGHGHDDRQFYDLAQWSTTKNGL